jgi:hypothetical protein
MTHAAETSSTSQNTPPTAAPSTLQTAPPTAAPNTHHIPEARSTATQDRRISILAPNIFANTKAALDVIRRASACSTEDAED